MQPPFSFPVLLGLVFDARRESSEQTAGAGAGTLKGSRCSQVPAKIPVIELVGWPCVGALPARIEGKQIRV